MISQFPALYLLLAAIIGVIIGLLVSTLFNSTEPRSKQEPPRELTKAGFAEVARLWYSPAGKKILVEMEGEPHKDFTSLTKEQQSKANRLAELLKGWVGGQGDTGAEPVTQEVEQTYVPYVLNRQEKPEEPNRPVYSAPVYETYKEEPVVSLEKPVNPFFSDEQEEDNLVSALKESLDDNVPLGAADTTVDANLSITQQISAVLDEMLEGTGLENKGIRLTENPSYGVDVWVGTEKFSGIDAVPYPQVSQLIRDAVMRWEQESEARLAKKD